MPLIKTNGRRGIAAVLRLFNRELHPSYLSYLVLLQVSAVDSLSMQASRGGIGAGQTELGPGRADRCLPSPSTRLG
jgi:hypothetical protein